MKFRKKRIILKIRNIASICFVLTILSTAFIVRILTYNNGIMTNLIMANIRTENDNKNTMLNDHEENKEINKVSDLSKDTSKVNEKNNLDINTDNKDINSNKEDVEDFKNKFDIEFKWIGEQNTEYKWVAAKEEERLIELEICLKNKSTNTKYNPGDIEIIVPGIGELNKNGNLKAINIIANEYELQEKKEEWSYKYDNIKDIYVFYNNKEINKKEKFIDSLKLSWLFSSKECINEFEKKIQAVLKYKNSSIFSKELYFSFNLKQDTNNNKEEEKNEIKVENKIEQEKLNFHSKINEPEYNLEILNVDEETESKLQGTQFEIYDKDGNKLNSNLTGDLEDNIAKNVKEGTYILKEKIKPIGYIQEDDFTLIIEDEKYTLKQGENILINRKNVIQDDLNSKIEIKIVSKREKGSILVKLVDEYLDNEKNEISQGGIEIELKDTNGKLIDKKTTDIFGNIFFENLIWGNKCLICEKDKINGYVQVVKEIYLDKMNKDKILNIEFLRKKGNIILKIEDENTLEKISGVKYGLYANNTIYNKYGEVEFEKDILIKEEKADEDGKVLFSDLIWGDYYIKELESVYGYNISNDRKLFTISAENVEKPIEKTEKKERRKAKIEIINLNENKIPIQGSEISLFKVDDSLLINKCITDENGKIKFDNLYWGDYYLQETIPAQGFIYEKVKYLFSVNRETFVDGKDIVKNIKNQDTNEQVDSIKSTKKRGKIILTTYACDEENEHTDKTLGNVKFELYFLDGRKINDYETNMDGEIIINDLEWGNYYLKEIDILQNYETLDEKITFEIDSTNVGFEQEIQVYKKQKKAEIKINKTIKSSSIEKAHGNSSFLFKIIGRDKKGEIKFTLYRVIKFTEADLQCKDEYITKSIILSELEKYTYEITEEKVFRYQVGDIIKITDNIDVNDKTAVINFTDENNKGEVTFVNNKTNNSLLTDAKLSNNI